TNKEEALRCLKIAKNQYGSKNYEAAVRLTKKSLALFETKEAKEFLTRAEEKAASGESTGSSSSIPQVQKEEKPTTREKPSASEQSKEVREILACGTDYYKVLKVAKNCTEVEMKKSYRKVKMMTRMKKSVTKYFFLKKACT
ncbi:hypothetical protein HPULCUR_005200, partial [Helicostylum pulchrum]